MRWNGADCKRIISQAPEHGEHEYMRNGTAVHETRLIQAFLGLRWDDKQKKTKDIPLEVVGPISETNKSTFIHQLSAMHVIGYLAYLPMVGPRPCFRYSAYEPSTHRPGTIEALKWHQSAFITALRWQAEDTRLTSANNLHIP